MAVYNKYPKEFKEYVCKLIVQDGRKQIDISKELNIPYDTLQKWISSYRKKIKDAESAKQKQLLTASELQDMLEEERAKRVELEEEVAILKKAMHIFTQEK